ncbi:HK97 gp10 family phage protein [Nocardiopsis eucommiae]|uniref:HK97 gp10 family phage protein n=1 Tax=Nocardiopsis eucommiae TaxID=2831970 RepID=A0A975LDA0_9ACTN|nr:HK97 gp10 family phage protein [Nocardiopsis eucommiae]
MPPAKVRINQATVKRLGVFPPVDRDLQRRAYRVQAMAQGRGPVRSGEYVRSIGVKRAPGKLGGWRVEATARHSWWVERGTRPHVIRPRVKKALFWPGAAHPVGKVNHPGTKATHNLAEALELAARGNTNV